MCLLIHRMFIEGLKEKHATVELLGYFDICSIFHLYYRIQIVVLSISLFSGFPISHPETKYHPFYNRQMLLCQFRMRYDGLPSCAVECSCECSCVHPHSLWLRLEQCPPYACPSFVVLAPKQVSSVVQLVCLSLGVISCKSLGMPVSPRYFHPVYR